MNLRYEILNAVARNPGATADDICEAIDYDRQKLKFSIADAVKSGLLKRGRDDVTGLPSYTLTAPGKARHKQGPGKLGRAGAPGVGQPATAAAPAKPAAKPAGKIPPPDYDPDTVAFDAAARAEAEKRRADGAEQDVASLLRIVADIRAAIGDKGQIMLDALAAVVGERVKVGDSVKDGVAMYEHAIGEIHRHCADAGIPVGSVHDRVAQLAAEHTRVLDELADIRRDHDQALRDLDDARQRTADLQTQIDGMVSPTLECQAAAGYIMTAAKRKPARMRCPERARAAAESAIRAGAQRAEVFALVPVGLAVRGAEWRQPQ